MPSLYSYYSLKGHPIINRLVMPPMVCFNWSDENGFVTDEHIQHYKKRGLGQVGLVIVEATAISKIGRLAPSQLGIWDHDQVEGLAKISEAIGTQGTKSLLQIHHAGDKAPKSVAPEPLAPSTYDLQDGRSTKALTLGEIKGIQKEFLLAALRAEEAGYDGIEIHGAHGYLINQFLSPLTNLREDLYGGSFQNRLRFVRELLSLLKDNLPDNFIIGYRHGGNTPTLAEGIEISKELEKMGVDLLHISAGIATEEDLPKPPEDFPYSWIVYSGVETKKQVNIPVIVVNGIRTPEEAEPLIEKGLTDFVAVGRGLLVDSQWVLKGEKGQSVNPCLRCKPRCFYMIDGKECPQYSKA